MSVQLDTIGATQLELGTRATKRNFATATTIGGAAGQVCGGYLGVFVTLPASFGGSVSQQVVLLGADTDRDGAVNEANESGIVIGGPSSTLAALRPRLRFTTLAIGSDNMAQMALSGSYLVLAGTTNRGSNASPAWINWIAYCDLATGTVHSWTQAHNNTFTTSTTHSVLEHIFMAAGTALTRTVPGFRLEHAAWIDGDFPWDTANDGSTSGSVAGQGRPHHDAIRALCGYGGTNYTYETLAAAQNAGTLPGGWTNLRSNGDAVDPRPGRATVTEWFRLPNLATLTNSGSNSSNSLAQVNYNSLSGGLSNAAAIAPAHWAPAGPAPPTILETIDKFIPGRGARAFTFAGTYDDVNTTALERRWVVRGTSTPVTGRDWADITSLSDGAWSFSETVPVGNCDLQVRDKNTPALAAESTDWLSGTRVLMHGQSAMALSIRTGFGGSALGPNLLNEAVASGAQGIVMRLNNMYANGGSGGSYAAPAAAIGRMRSGETPAVGHGAILFLNTWNVHNPGHPLMICNMAINTHAMDNWTANDVIPDGDPTWRFMGPATPTPPGAANGNDSGVVSYFAWLLGGSGGGYVDMHMLMWSPGMSTTDTGRAAYRAAIDARFSQSASAPWLVIPPWRFHRSLPDINAGPSVRSRHVDFVNELNTLTPGRGIPGPSWQDIVNDGTGSGHPAFNTSPGVPDAAQNVSDGNRVGQGRLGLGFGWALAWAYDRRIKANGPRLVGAWWRDASVRTIIEVELARQCRTLAGAAVYAGQFWVGTDNGATFSNTGFSVALSADGTRAVLTKDSGAWPATNVRVEVHWVNPFGPDEMASEADAEVQLRGLLYDSLTYRGGTDLAAGVRPGNVLQGTSRAGAGNAGVAVTARGAAKLVTTERFTGSRTVTVRLMSADGNTVLREKALAITAS